MKFFTLYSTLISSVCFAADSRPAPNTDDDNQLFKIMKERPEQLHQFLVTSKGWEKDLAMAFAVGLALGNQCDKQKFIQDNNKAGDQERENEKDILDLIFVRWTKDAYVLVFMENLNNSISAEFEWEDGDRSYNPFSELFDIQYIQDPHNYKNKDELSLGKLRRLFAKYAKSAVSMIAIDVAILKWLVHVIKSRPDDHHLVDVTFVPLCALSLHPQVKEYCTQDILTVLTQVQYCISLACSFYSDHKMFTPSLLTLVKMLDDGPIRTKVEEIVAKMYPMLDDQSYTDCRMFLKDDHSVVKQMKEKIRKEHIPSDISLDTQSKCDREMHSMGFSCWINAYAESSNFFGIGKHYHLSAIIEENKALRFEGTTPKLCNSIYFSNKSSRHPKQICLFIISELPAPAIFWERVTSCKSLSVFKEILKDPIVRMTILTYGITILESSSVHKLEPALKQDDATIEANGTS